MKKILYVLLLLLITPTWAADDFVPAEEEDNSGNSYILDADNSGGDISLQFGEALGEYLQWNDTNTRFDLTNSLRVGGYIEQNGNIFTLDVDNTGSGNSVSIIANQGTDNDGELRYNATNNVWEVSNDGGAFIALGEEIDATDDLFFAYDLAGGTSIGNVPTDIPFDTEVREDSEFTHATNSAEITINTSGQYLVDYECTMDVVGTARNIVYHWLEADDGGGFSELPGTRAGSYHRTTGDGIDTGSIQTYQSFVSGDIIKSVAQADQAGVISTTANGCRMKIQRVDNARGLIGPVGPQGPTGPSGTNGISGGGWGEDGTTTTTALHAQIEGDLVVDGDIGSECGPSAVFWSGRGTVVSNESWALGNGQTPYGSIMGCNGVAKKIAATCTGSIGTSLTAVLRKNNVATACTVNISTTVGQATISNCNESFVSTDVLGVYAGTESGAWTECVGTFWVKYGS